MTNHQSDRPQVTVKTTSRTIRRRSCREDGPTRSAASASAAGNDSKCEVIVIAPSLHIASAVLRADCHRVRCFASFDEFDAWRSSVEIAEHSIAQHVDDILSTYTDTVLPPKLQFALIWLRWQASVPPLKAFAESACARRSFFRLWARTIPDPPARFLNRVRAVHAASLLAGGEPVNDVLRFTGCRTVSALQRLLDSWH